MSGQTDESEYEPFQWRGTEDEQFRELDKACKARCNREGDEDCPHEDHWCAECEYDMAWALRVRKSDPSSEMPRRQAEQEAP